VVGRDFDFHSCQRKPNDQRGKERKIERRNQPEMEQLKVGKTLMTLIDSIPVAIVSTDKENKVTMWNPAAERIFGWSKQEMLGKPFKVVSQDKNLNARSICENQASSETVVDLDQRRQKKDGSYVYLSSAIAPLRNEKGDIIGTTAIMTDVTDRKQAEELMRRSEERFRTLAESAPFGISIMKPDRSFEYFNPKFTEIFGYTLKDLPDKASWFKKAYPDEEYRNKVAAVWYQDWIEGSEVDEIKPKIFTVRCKNGRDIIIHFRAVAQKDEKQLITYEDVTDQTIAEEALRGSEAKYKKLYEESQKTSEVYRSLIHSSADAIVLCDLAERVKYISPFFTRIFGWSMEDVEGKPIPFLPEFEKESTHKRIKDLVETGTPCQGFETKRYTKDGRLIDVSISASRYDDHESKPAGILVILQDISKRKELEAEFLQAHKFEAIGTLAGGIAHDFNNLLMGIQGNASLALVNMDPNHPNYSKLKNIEQYVQSGAELTKQLLGFARSGKYEVTATDLNELVEKTTRMFGRTKKEINIHTKFQQDIWATEVDRGQTEQVLLNLYINAWQAMPGGGNIYIETENVIIDPNSVKQINLETGKYVKISITDTGEGMEEEIQQRIFDPFFTTKKMGSGTGRGSGLGLASAYGIIKNHGGIITVSSEKGKGANFTIYLPATEKYAVKEATPPNDLKKGKETILLIDDEDMIIDTAGNMLVELGYQVLTAIGGKEALKVFRQNKDQIDLVILDMIMPDLSGSDTYNGLIAIKPTLRVLLSSGYSLNGQAAEILQLGCDGFIQKPFNLRTLSLKIRETFQKDQDTCLRISNSEKTNKETKK
jgi:PAS domain S-box-containing protein